jgi:hypothetical protein
MKGWRELKHWIELKEQRELLDPAEQRRYRHFTAVRSDKANLCRTMQLKLPKIKHKYTNCRNAPAYERERHR